VRRDGRASTARRALLIADFSPVVAARVVSIAAAEMVRVQARVGQASGTVVDAPHDGDDQDAALAVGADAALMILPASHPLLWVGSGLALEHRALLSPEASAAQALYGRLLVGDEGERRGRWLEIGAALELRWRFAPGWRLHAGARGGGVALSVPHAVSVDGAPSSGEEWTARVSGAVGVDTHLVDQTWLSLGVEPGAMLRGLSIAERDGTRSQLEGFTLVTTLGLRASPWR
jgi:hypothetical protein